MFGFLPKLLLATFIVISPLLVRGQYADNTNLHNSVNIYYQTLTHIIEYERANSRGGDTIYLEDNWQLDTDSILTSIGPTKIIILDYLKLRNVLNAKKYIALYRLFALKYENGEFSVSCVPFATRFERKHKWYEKKHKVITLSNGGGFHVYFKFEDKQFKFLRIKEWGI